MKGSNILIASVMLIVGPMIEELWNVPEGTNFMIEIGDDLKSDAISRWPIEDRMGVQFAESGELPQLNRAAISRMAY